MQPPGPPRAGRVRSRHLSIQAASRKAALAARRCFLPAIGDLITRLLAAPSISEATQAVPSCQGR